MRPSPPVPGTPPCDDDDVAVAAPLAVAVDDDGIADTIDDDNDDNDDVDAAIAGVIPVVLTTVLVIERLE